MALDIGAQLGPGTAAVAVAIVAPEIKMAKQKLFKAALLRPVPTGGPPLDCHGSDRDNQIVRDIPPRTGEMPGAGRH